MSHKIEGQRKLEDNWMFSRLWKNYSVVQDCCLMRVGLVHNNYSG